MQLLLLGLTTNLIAHMGLQVLVLRYQAAHHNIYNDVRLTDVDQHVVLKRLLHTKSKFS